MCTAGRTRLSTSTAPISGCDRRSHGSGAGLDPLPRRSASLPALVGVKGSRGPLPARAALQAKYTAKASRHVWKRPDQQHPQQQQAGRPLLANAHAQPRPAQGASLAVKSCCFEASALASDTCASPCTLQAVHGCGPASSDHPSQSKHLGAGQVTGTL